MWRAGLACARRVATVRLPAAQRTAAPLRRHYSNVVCVPLTLNSPNRVSGTVECVLYIFVIPFPEL